MQAWDNGLKRFLSNVPEETPNNTAALAKLEAHFRCAAALHAHSDHHRATVHAAAGAPSAAQLSMKSYAAKCAQLKSMAHQATGRLPPDVVIFMPLIILK